MVYQMLSSSSTSSEETSNSNTTTSTTTNSIRTHSQPFSNTSSSSASSSSSSSKPLIPSSPRTMEDVWKDINLSSITETPSLHQMRSTHRRPSTTSFRSNTNIFQDFLARPFDNESQISPQPQPPLTRRINVATDFSTPITSNNTTTKAKSSTTRATLFGSLNASSSSCSSPSPPKIPTNNPVTVLSLNSSPDFNFLDSSVESLIRPNNANPVSNIYSFTNPFEALPCTSGKKRFPSSEDSGFTTNSSGGGDRRHKRMIKNRESAARSRARKQAYTVELENEVNTLREENAKLKRQHKLLDQKVTLTTSQIPKKNSLQRTSTAPF